MKLGIAGLVLAALALAGCPPTAASPQSKAQLVVVDVARGIRLADHLCAQAAIAKSDAAIADRCAKAYDHTRSALLAVESAIDAWNDAQAGKLGCALQDAVEGGTELVSALTKAGVEVPSELATGKQAAALLALAWPCVRVVDGGAQ